jgi:hypothetical protein
MAMCKKMSVFLSFGIYFMKKHDKKECNPEFKPQSLKEDGKQALISE